MYRIITLGMLAAATAAPTLAQPALSTRPPSAAEIQSWHNYLQSHYPGAPLQDPQVSRASTERQWRVLANVDAAPSRAVLPLCRMQRTRFALTGGQWQAQPAPQQFIWIHHTAQCGAPPPAMVELRQALPEIDILKLIQAEGELLQRSRLLMAGNTRCAPTRARSFHLEALGRAKDGLFELVYRSDIDSTLTLSVRPSRAELTAWNVDCT
jgi:hypothetical protein